MKNFIAKLISNIKTSVLRFIAAFGFSVVLCGSMIGYLFFSVSETTMDFLTRINCLTVLGFFICTLGVLIWERYKEKIKINGWQIQVALALGSCLLYPLLLAFEDSGYFSLAYGGILTALFTAILYFANHEEISLTLSYIVKNTVFNAAVCGLLNIGIYICYEAFKTLLYNSLNTDILGEISVIIWIILFSNLSLSTLPRKTDELKIPKLFKLIVGYVALPVYLLLILILYGYLAKIVVTWSFPSGEVNWFASFASLLFVFFIITLKQYREEHKAIRLFVKYGGWLIIPIIIMQFIAVYIRLDSYGLTSIRYISIMLNGLALAFAIVSLIKDGKYVKYMLLALVATCLLITVTPLNAYDVALRDQTQRIIATLKKNDMLKDGKIIANPAIPLEDKVIITDSFDYVMRNYIEEKGRIAPLDDCNYNNFSIVFGFERQYAEGGEIEFKYGAFYGDGDIIDVDGYSKIYKVRSYYTDSGENNTFSMIIEDKTYSYNLLADIQDLYNKYGRITDEKILMEYYVEGNKLLLSDVNFEVDGKGQIRIEYFEGWFMIK